MRTALLVVGFLSACAPEVTPRLQSHPARPTDADAPVGVVADNARCVVCHEQIGAEWQASLHRQSWDDPVFLSAYAAEPLEFCRNCHAPEAQRASEEASHIGVGCVTCHRVGGDILGTHDVDRRGDAHAVLGDATLGTATACASCHEFNFPQPQDALMQSTVSEHARSLHRDKSCQECHMPEVDGHRSHAFQVITDPVRLRSAVSASAALAGERNLEITLQVSGAGHDVPTGDMFRRLVIRANAGDNAARPKVLARTFRREETAEGSRRVQSGDDRLSGTGEPRVVSLFFLHPIEGPVAWQVVYQRMGPYEAALFGVDLDEDETIVASGVIEGDQEQ